MASTALPMQQTSHCSAAIDSIETGGHINQASNAALHSSQHLTAYSPTPPNAQMQPQHYHHLHNHYAYRGESPMEHDAARRPYNQSHLNQHQNHLNQHHLNQHQQQYSQTATDQTTPAHFYYGPASSNHSHFNQRNNPYHTQTDCSAQQYNHQQTNYYANQHQQHQQHLEQQTIAYNPYEPMTNEQQQQHYNQSPYSQLAAVYANGLGHNAIATAAAAAVAVAASAHATATSESPATSATTATTTPTTTNDNQYQQLSEAAAGLGQGRRQSEVDSSCR